MSTPAAVQTRACTIHSSDSSIVASFAPHPALRATFSRREKGCTPEFIDGLDGSGGNNEAPVANFISSTSGMTVTFTDLSSDSDGSIASYNWNFGDGTTSTAANPGRTYAGKGLYNVVLTVTDDDGGTASKMRRVKVGQRLHIP